MDALRLELNETETERDRLREELAVKAGWYSPDQYQALAEIIHQRDIEREESRKQIAELRSHPTPSPGTLALPAADNLLNKLKQRKPKSKTTLGDVETLYELIEEQTSD